MSKIGIIIQHEYSQRVRKKSFILTTILIPLLILGMYAGMIWLMMKDSTSEKNILVVDRSGWVAPQLENSKTLTFTPTDKSPEEIRQARTGGEFGYLVIGADIVNNPSDLQLYSYEQSTVEIDGAITKQIKAIVEAEKLKTYQIENLDRILAEVKTNVTLSTYRIDTATGEEKESSSTLAMILAGVFGFLTYFFVLIYGGMVMQGVIREKSSKVLEIMVSSVRPFELMFGKIIGIALVAFTQLALWVVLLTLGSTLLGGAIVGSIDPATAAQMSAGAGMDMAQITAGMNPEGSAMLSMLSDTIFILKILLSFVLYFIGGYLLYAAMFAAVGSAVDNEADTQQLQLPITMPLIFGFVIMATSMRDPDSSLAFWGSIIPLTSPIVMMARLPYGVPAWQLILSIVLLYATFVAIAWLAARIYRVGIFMYGKKPTWKDLAKWITYKD